MSLARLTQLFAEGTELVLTPPAPHDSEQVVVWVAKLNSFEEEQANQAGRVARARLINAIKEIGTPEYDYVRSQMSEQLTSAMVSSIVQSKDTELFVRAMTDMRSDPLWYEKIMVLDQTDASKLDGIELAAHKKLEAEYSSALLELHEQLLKDLRADLDDMVREDVEEQFETAYLHEQGMAAFGIERGRQHIFLCMRICQATPPPDDNARWSHSRCDHRQHFLADPDEVDHLPQDVRDLVEAAYASVSVPPSVARFTGALGSSSASPERSATEAVSTPSGPGETSPAQATT